jgi:hypothetical protein
MPARGPATGWEAHMELGLSGKTAVVAEGSRGCGRGISEVLNFGEILGTKPPPRSAASPGAG